jgi:hypothetical protein
VVQIRKQKQLTVLEDWLFDGMVLVAGSTQEEEEIIITFTIFVILI